MPAIPQKIIHEYLRHDKNSLMCGVPVVLMGLCWVLSFVPLLG